MFGIVFMFLAMNRNSCYNEQFIQKQGISGFLRLPLTNEDIEISEEMKEVLNNTIKVIPPKGLLDEKSPQLGQLLKTIEANGDIIGKRMAADVVREQILKTLTIQFGNAHSYRSSGSSNQGIQFS